VIRLSGGFCGIDISGNTVRAGAGASLPDLLKKTSQNSLEGLEFLTGIPGSVGGAVYGNSGANRMCMADVIEEIEIYRPRAGGFIALKRDEINFAYRTSGIKSKEVITRCRFALKRGIKTDIISRIKSNIEKKKQTQPLDSKSCGCVFKNPDNGKTSAAELIRDAGLAGLRIGDVEVSAKHANFIVNTGNASSGDIWNLIKKVKESVKQKSGKELELEINLLGEGFE
jgi:UDP-N-acetylmuramate dehydrogenase